MSQAHNPDFTRAFRNALGTFATGIAVVTTRTPGGDCFGVTINSFNSVSLEPPLVVWSLARHLASLPAFEGSEYYAINILAADQQGLSQHFATRSDDKFAVIEYDEGLGRAPLLRDCCAWFECRNTVRHPGGDHVMFVGEVEHFRHTERDPLLYFRGAYRGLTPL